MMKMNKTTLTLALASMIGAAPVVAQDTVRLVISQGKAVVAKQTSVSAGDCVSTPDGLNKWCVPAQTVQAQAKSLSAKQIANRISVVELDSFGYDTQTIVNTLSASGNFGIVEADVATYTPDAKPTSTYGGLSAQNTNDPHYSFQAKYFGSSSTSRVGMNVTEAWAASTANNPDVDVVVMDSSFFVNGDVTYAGGASFVTAGGESPGNDFTPRAEDVAMCNGHGLGVAAVVGATIDNTIGTAGVAQNVKIHAVRTMNCGVGFMSDNAVAMDWLRGESVAGVAPYTGESGVINLSLGAVTDRCPVFMQNAIDAVIDDGWTVVVAAGNTGLDVSQFSPANCEGVITVGAVTDQGELSQFSNFGEGIDVSAIGENVVAPCDETTDACFWEGTSFAAPLVAGALAHAKQQTGAGDAVLKAALSLTANKGNLGSSCATGVCGNGIADAKGVLDIAIMSRDGNLNSIGFALDGNSNCEQTWFVDFFGQSGSLCGLYQVTFMGGFVDSNTTYELVSVNKGGSFTNPADVTVLGEFDGGVAMLRDLDIDGTDYGFKVCTNGNCDDEVIALDSSAATDENMPAACRQ